MKEYEIVAKFYNACAGDFIILAGKGHETYQEIGHEKFHLDEREEVAAHLMGN